MHKDNNKILSWATQLKIKLCFEKSTTGQTSQSWPYGALHPRVPSRNGTLLHCTRVRRMQFVKGLSVTSSCCVSRFGIAGLSQRSVIYIGFPRFDPKMSSNSSVFSSSFIYAHINSCCSTSRKQKGKFTTITVAFYDK